MIGVIGRGNWGNVYTRTLAEMGVDYWQAGRDWKYLSTPDGAIIATTGESHYEIATDLMMRHVPVLIEKPVCMSSEQANNLLELAKHTDAIAFVNSRVFSPEWEKFKKSLGGMQINRIYAQAGGPCKLDPVWDWMPHILSMCLDIGAPQELLSVRLFKDRRPFRFVVNDVYAFEDRMTSPTPIRNVVQKFLDAIEKETPNWKSLALGVKTVEMIDAA